MTDPHICQEPGCGLAKTEYVPPGPIYKDEGYYRCPRNADAHALCARVAELEAKLERRDIMEDRTFVRGLETGFSLGLERDRKGYTKTLEAYSRGIHEALEEAAKKGQPHA